MIFVVNCLVTALFLAIGIAGLPTGLQGVCAWALPAAIVSQAAFLNLVPALLTVLVVAILAMLSRPSRRTMRIVAGLTFGIFQIAVLSDLAIFRLFRRHFDGLIWSALTTPGASDVLRPGFGTVITIAAVVLALFAHSLWLSGWLVPRLASLSKRGMLLNCSFGLILICALWERTVFALVGLSDFSAVESVRNLLPFYQPATVKSLARKLGYKPEPATRISLPDQLGIMNLPRQPLGPVVGLRRPNILIIAIEGARFDTLTATNMPNVSALAGDAWWLQQHFSTGNETRFGIFGLLYGVEGSYWPAAMAHQKSSHWIDFLAAQNYEFSLMGSANLDYSGCRRTAFRAFNNRIRDKWDGPRVDRDRLMTDAFVQFLGKRDRPPHSPFFGFLFYDASHQPYEYPPEDAIFPSEFAPGDLNYAKIAVSPQNSKRFKGLYQNALHYIDRQIGRILEELRRSEEYENTIVVVVGDHGEEFGECGQFGHTSSFNRFQTQTLGVLRFPGEKPRVVTKLTSHVDFVPSVLQWMGVTNPLQDYTTGLPIQGDMAHSFVAVSGWQKAALVKTDSVTVFSQYAATFLNGEYQPLKSGDPRRPTAGEIAKFMNQTRWFLK